MEARVQFPVPPQLWPGQSRAGAGIWPATQRAAAKQAVADLPRLAKRERVLVTEQDVVATDLALYRRGETGWTRAGWEQIERAAWDASGQRLMLTGTTPAIPRFSLPLPARSPLVALVRERIGWTTLLVTEVHLDGLGQAWVSVRREPANGALLWFVRPHPSVDPADPRLAGRIDAAIRWLRAQMGVPGS